MGSSESKIAVQPKEASTPKPDPIQIQRLKKNDRVNRLLDPRSPSMDIDRTPIQIGGAVIRTSIEDRVCISSNSDPRSPSVGVTRTPIKGAVGSLARMGLLFLGVSVSSKHSAPSDLKVEEEVGGGEQASSEALLSSRTDDSSSPELPCLQSVCSDSLSFQTQLDHLAEAEVEVETEAEVEADFTFEEAEEARESLLHKRLSMSLITCHEGAVPAQVLADIHHAYPPSPLSHAATEPRSGVPEHSYALPSITFDLTSHVTLSQPTVVAVANVSQGPEELVEVESLEVAPVEAESVDVSPVEAESVDVSPVEAESVDVSPVEAESVDVSPVEAESVYVSPVEAESVDVSPVEAKPVDVARLEAESVEVTPVEVEPTELAQASSPSPDLQPQTGIRCPIFDAKSPSQVVFKPQWLGKGFGTTGVRARGKGGKGASPLSVWAGTKKSTNENKAQSKQKQRGKGLAEGRSPLQILKETNSPRDHHSQTKLKVSTPDRQRPGQLDRRVLTTVLDKENR